MEKLRTGKILVYVADSEAYARKRARNLGQLVVAAPGGERFITVAPRLYLAIIDGELCGEEEGDK